MSEGRKRDRLGEVITDAVGRLREFARVTVSEYDADDMDGDIALGLHEVYAEPPEGTPDAWLVADVALVCAAYEMMRCERDALLRKAGGS